MNPNAGGNPGDPCGVLITLDVQEDSMSPTSAPLPPPPPPPPPTTTPSPTSAVPVPTVPVNPGNLETGQVKQAFVNVDDYAFRPRFCLTCQIVKPDRTHHCSVCDQCVLRMDQ